MEQRTAWQVIFDAHFHLREHEAYDDSVGIFTASGGNSFNLVNLPDYSLPHSNYYETLYERTVRTADMVRKEYKVHVIVSLGPYPLDYQFFLKNKEDPVSSILHGLELAGRFISSGRASGIGEIGRAHFATDTDMTEFSNRFMEESFEKAKDLDCFVMLHTEDLTPETIMQIERMADRCGLLPKRVIKHHATSQVLDVSQVTKSFPATKKNARMLSLSRAKGMLETDFIDDPVNKQKFLPPDSVPRRALMIRQNFDDSDDILYKIFQQIPFDSFQDDFFLQ